MWEQYAPDPRMKLNLGIRRRLAPLLDNDARKIELAHSLLFTLPGSPILYYGDEIGMGDNIWLFDRNGVRTPMQWNTGSNAGFSDATEESLFAPVIDDETFGSARVNVEVQQNDPQSLWNVIRQMIAERKKHPQFGRGDFHWIDLQNDHIAAYERTYQGETILALHNMSDSPQTVSLETKKSANKLTDLLTSKKFDARTIGLAPYEFYWLI